MTKAKGSVDASMAEKRKLVGKTSLVLDNNTAIRIKNLRRTLWGLKPASSVTLPSQPTMNGPGHTADLDSYFICPEKRPRVWAAKHRTLLALALLVCVAGLGAGAGLLWCQTQRRG